MFAFEFIRSLTIPFKQIEKHLPEEGRILDIGCGHGVFTRLIAAKSGKRQVLGIDPSQQKIKLATKKVFKNLSFTQGRIEDLTGKKYDAITTLDVLYLFPYQKKIEFLSNVKRLLKKGGVFVLVINGKDQNFLQKLLEIEETVMVRMLRYTHTDFPGLHFLDTDGYEALLKKAGFKVTLRKKLVSTLHYPPHYLLVSHKDR